MKTLVAEILHDEYETQPWRWRIRCGKHPPLAVSPRRYSSASNARRALRNAQAKMGIKCVVRVLE